MSIFSAVYNFIFVEPLLNALVYLTGIVPFHDLGISIVILTLAVRFIIFPFTHKSIKTQARMKALEPEIGKIREKYKNSQEQAKRTMALYKEHGVSPFSGCLILLIQIPILLALYRLFLGGVDIFDAGRLYSFISPPADIRTSFLGLLDVNQKSVFMAVFTGLSQFFQMRLAMPPVKNKNIQKSSGSSFKDELSRSMSFQAKYILPGVIFFIALKLPAAVSLYWTTTNVFAIVHEGIVRKKAKKIYGKRGDRGNLSSEREQPLGKDKAAH